MGPLACVAKVIEISLHGEDSPLQQRNLMHASNDADYLNGAKSPQVSRPTGRYRVEVQPGRFSGSVLVSRHHVRMP